MRIVQPAVVLLTLVLASAALAQTSRPQQPTDAEKLKEYVRLNGELARLIEKKEYSAAADACRRMIELSPKQNQPHYNLACCLARMGKNDEALKELKQAIDLGFLDLAHIRADDDLASLRELPEFKKLLADAEQGEKARIDKLYEKGQPIAGVRTVEGDPAGGLRWRLRMRAGPASQPDRLIIWLHPSGGSMNSIVEPLAPNLIKRGYALLVLTAKDWSGWNSQDSDKLLKQTLDDVARQKLVDCDRPILFGYSAGGQLALRLWYSSPEKFGGLVLDAAYPVIANRSTGRYALMPPPRKPGVKDCPIFVLVGDRDNGAGTWRLAEDPYAQAGVPMVVHYVPGLGHTWLLGGAQREKLYQWLSDVAAGKKPGTPSPQSAVPASQPSGPPKPIRLQDVY